MIVTVRIAWKVAGRWINRMNRGLGSSAQTVGVEFSLSGEGIAHPDEN